MRAQFDLDILKIHKSGWFYWAAFQNALQIVVCEFILTETADF